jgi:hypothetical protein
MSMGTSTNGPCKVLQSKGKDFDIDRGEEQPLALPCSRMHESKDIEPFISLLHVNHRTLSSACPDTPDDRLKANTMLIHCPQLHLRLRMGMLDLVDLLWQLALERLLLLWISLVVAGTRHLEGEAEPLEILPAALRMDRTPELFAHPASDFGTGPQATIGRSLCKPLP